MNLDALILKQILLEQDEEPETDQEPKKELSPFEEDPMGFILKKYHTLNELLTELMTDSFQEYLNAIFIVAPKPTTFKILLHNGQYFFLTYLDKAYQATISGKNYYLMTVGEKQLCMQAIARLLRFGSPLKTKGPEGAEQGTEGAEEAGGGEEAAAPETPPAESGEETLTEAAILSEMLKLSTVNEEPKAVSRPSTGNETSLKEGLVCLFYDVFKIPSLVTEIEDLHALATTKQAAEAIKEEDVKKVTDKIAQVYNKNKQYYGSSKSMPENLDLYVKYVFLTGQEIDTLTNAISAAASMHKEVSAEGRVIRNQDFDEIRTKAVSLIKEQYNISLQADNWCPGDVYIVLNQSGVSNALKADTINIGKSSLNHQFEKNGDLIAVSLKEEKAQAGKATTFASTVFSNTFDANVDPNDKYGTSDNKDLAKISAKIARFEDYYYGPKRGGKRSQSYINSVTKDKKLHGSVNSILQAVGKQKIKTSDIKGEYSSEQAFFNANKTLFNDLESSIKTIKSKLTGADSATKVKKSFTTSRDKFISDIKKYKIEVSAEDSNKFSKDIEKENEDYIKVLSMKTATYELASLIMDRWTDKNAKISPAYKKIQEISNPFVALTAFAIAEAGLSPSFYKVIGSSKSLMGHADYFDAKAEVDIDSSSTKMTLVDSPKQAGFLLSYVTKLGKKSYSTKLVFRFSGSEIRIEVQELKAQ